MSTFTLPSVARKLAHQLKMMMSRRGFYYVIEEYTEWTDSLRKVRTSVTVANQPPVFPNDIIKDGYALVKTEVERRGKDTIYTYTWERKFYP